MSRLDPRTRAASLILTTALLAGAAACGSSSPTARLRPTASADGETATAAPTQATPGSVDDATAAIVMKGGVGQFVSTPHTFSTSSFVIEGPSGLILIDTHFTPSEAERFVDAAESATGKVAELAIVLHPNPDKFNGTETLQKRGVRVVTSEQVLAAIPAVFEQRTRAFAGRYAPDWPTVTPAPHAFGARTTELTAAGTKLKLHVLGPGCSAAHVAVEWDGPDGKHVFAGDLIAHGAHSWLELGTTAAWLERLAELRALRPRHVHPGRGASAGAELIDAEEAYLRDVEAFVAAEKPTLPVSKEALGRVAERVKAAYPEHDFAVFLRIGLPAVWKRQAGQAAGEKRDAVPGHR